MEFRRLMYFVAVAEELHFGRAASRLHMAQPPLSQQIRRLEEDLEVRLFERTNRRVELTKAGHAYLEEARDILAHLERAGQRARLVDEGMEGELRVGFIAPAMDGPLPEVIREYRNKRPQIHLQLHEAGSARLLEMLATRRLDIACIRYFDQDLRGFQSLIYQREPYVVALPANSPFAGQDSITLVEMCKHPVIFFPRKTHPSLYDSFMSAFRAAGVVPRFTQEALSKHTLVALVAAGVGVGFVPQSMAGSPHTGVVYKPLHTLETKLPDVELAAVHTFSEVPELRFFVELIGSNVRGM